VLHSYRCIVLKCLNSNLGSNFNCLSVFKIETLFLFNPLRLSHFWPVLFSIPTAEVRLCTFSFSRKPLHHPSHSSPAPQPRMAHSLFSFSSALLGPFALKPNSSSLPFQPRTQPNPLFWPSSGPSRGRPAAVADGRAPPVIPDLESETDWGQSPTPSRPPPRA
jgi:hypothetical protein